MILAYCVTCRTVLALDEDYDLRQRIYCSGCRAMRDMRPLEMTPRVKIGARRRET